MDIDSKESRPPSGTALFNPKSVVNEKGKEYESLQWILDLFMKLGSGYFALSHYQCHEALQIFNSVTSSQRETPWVLAQIGRSLYEQANYVEAAKYYARIKTMAPSRLEDMEFYSTILWHLKNEIDLAFVAHEIIDIDRNSPQAWCAVGNSFSLQRDHDQALKCFRRATQLDPKFAYAFTLQGHEHVANEEYDKAMTAYRNGIAAENRHYNAWYGLGKVYEKQGKYAVAEQHYITAVTINPTNAVLLMCIGVVLEKMKKPHQALEKYTRSCELAPKSALSRFKKARILMGLQLPEQALAELQILKDIAPDEANVHFLLGRVYKILRDKGSAIKHFTTALNLDPKVCPPAFRRMERKLLTRLGLTLHQGSDGANGG
jgi:anaphase-promoting complex subunit 3